MRWAAGSGEESRLRCCWRRCCRRRGPECSGTAESAASPAEPVTAPVPDAGSGAGQRGGDGERRPDPGERCGRGAKVAAFQPFSEATAYSREDAIERLIDRRLILQQVKLQTKIRSRMRKWRRSLRRCARTFRRAGVPLRDGCGVAEVCGGQGFTMEEVRERWRQRMEVLRFIEIVSAWESASRVRKSRSTTRRQCCRSTQEKATAPKLETIAAADPGDIAAAAGEQAAGGLADGVARAGERADDEARRGGAMSEMQPGRETEVQPVETNGAPGAGCVWSGASGREASVVEVWQDHRVDGGESGHPGGGSGGRYSRGTRRRMISSVG